MRNIIAITIREVNAYFFSPLAYIVAFTFLGLTGFFFHMMLWSQRQATMEPVIFVMAYLVMLLAPLITMRLIAEEARAGTIETLMTAPVTERQLVLGKFAGAMLFYILLLAPTLAYVAVLDWLGEPDYGLVVTGYLGLLLMGALCLSVGLLCSAMTSSQVVAAVLGVVALLFLFVIGAGATWLPPHLEHVLRYAAFMTHQETFARGVIDSRDLVYYLSLTGFFLFLSIRVVERRAWR